MALHKIEVGKFRRSCLNGSRSWVEFIQTYARKSEPKEIVNSETHWLAKSFGSDKELSINVIRNDFMQPVKSDLLSSSLDMDAKGFLTVGFGIRVGQCSTFYAVDAFDAKNMNIILEEVGINSKIPDKSTSLEL